jgi:hypothetical protein
MVVTDLVINLSPVFLACNLFKSLEGTVTTDLAARVPQAMQSISFKSQGD